MRRARLTRLAAAALACLAAPAGAAQPAPAEPAQSPADVLTSDEVAAMFARMAAAPLSSEAVGELPPEIAAPVNAFVEESLARGERVPGWRQSPGVDLREVIRAREGGLAANMLLATTEIGPQHSYFDDEPLESLVPRQWVLVGRHGRPVAGPDVQVNIGRIAPKVIMAERILYRRQGTALCLVRSDARFYADPDVPASEIDLISLFFALRVLPLLDQRGFCQVIEERDPGVYVARLFDREGYRLPGLEQPGRPLRIAPRAPFPSSAPAR